MPIYCVSDIRGRFDLLQSLIEQIELNPHIDTLYSLGGAIYHQPDGVRVLTQFMRHPQFMRLILGEEEQDFLQSVETFLDPIMKHPTLKQGLLPISQEWTKHHAAIKKTVFRWIEDERQFPTSTPLLSRLETDPSMVDWMIEHEEETETLKNLFALIESVQFGEDEIQWIDAFLPESAEDFIKKPFQEELLTLDYSIFHELVQFLRDCPTFIETSIQGEAFVLCHDLEAGIPLANESEPSDPRIHVFGKLAISFIHRNISHLVEFNEHQVLATKDQGGHRYFNLNLAPTGMAALRLDDLTPFYVTKTSLNTENSSFTQHPLTQESPTNIQPLKGTVAYSKRFLTYDHQCLEFLVEISTDKTRIHVTDLYSLCRYPQSSPQVHYFSFPTADLNDTEILEEIHHRLLHPEPQSNTSVTPPQKKASFLSRLFKSSKKKS